MINHWGEAPYLFSNGMFSAKVNNEWGIQGNIIGFENDRNFWGFKVEHTVMSAPDIFTCETCDLIARNPKLLTDDEVDKIPSLINLSASHEEKRKMIIFNLIYGYPRMDDIIYLLEIGVYPLKSKIGVIFK